MMISQTNTPYLCSRGESNVYAAIYILGNFVDTGCGGSPNCLEEKCLSCSNHVSRVPERDHQEDLTE